MLHEIIGQVDPNLHIYWSGGTRAARRVMHLALFTPYVRWDRKKSLEPWNKLGPNDPYKLYSVNVDYSKRKKEGPDF